MTISYEQNKRDKIQKALSIFKNWFKMDIKTVKRFGSNFESNEIQWLLLYSDHDVKGL